MSAVPALVADFLAQKRIVVAGVSRDGVQPANAVYRRLRRAGYDVAAVNPNAEVVEGDPCYPDLFSVPGLIDGVVVATPPEATDDLVAECVRLGVPRVWMHRAFGRGSVSQRAVDCCREHGIEVIPGGCPMMYCEPVDLGHRCMRWMLRRRLPA